MPESNSDKTPETEVARYRRFIETRNESAERKDFANRALDCFERLAKEDHIQRNDLEPLVAASRHPHIFVWDIGTVFLVKLAVTDATARDVITELVGDKKANVRNSIIWALKGELPREFLLQTLRVGLSDRSKKVRQQAIKVSDMLRVNELVPELQEMLETEQDREVQRTLQFHIPMMTDGYLLEYDDRKEPQLIVRTNSGWGSARITQEDIDAGRLPDIVRAKQASAFS